MAKVVPDCQSDSLCGLSSGVSPIKYLGPVPRRAARSYYAENLPASMKKEAQLFFAGLLENDGPVTELLDADYTFVDKKLAKLYQLPEQNTLRLKDGFQRVSIADNRQRGGVLGMAAVLTVSANGVETSPITRGVFVSENILGVTPPPPPDEVPAIEPDTRGRFRRRFSGCSIIGENAQWRRRPRHMARCLVSHHLALSRLKSCVQNTRIRRSISSISTAIAG